MQVGRFGGMNCGSRVCSFSSAASNLTLIIGCVPLVTNTNYMLSGNLQADKECLKHLRFPGNGIL